MQNSCLVLGIGVVNMILLCILVYFNTRPINIISRVYTNIVNIFKNNVQCVFQLDTLNGLGVLWLDRKGFSLWLSLSYGSLTIFGINYPSIKFSMRSHVLIQEYLYYYMIFQQCVVCALRWTLLDKTTAVMYAFSSHFNVLPTYVFGLDGRYEVIVTSILQIFYPQLNKKPFKCALDILV